MRVGEPLRSETLFTAANQSRRLLMDALGLAVAELLPVRYRGVYEDQTAFKEASALLGQSRR